MPKLFCHFLFVLLVSISNCHSVFGDLVLSIDTTNETVSLSGSTTGVPANGFVSWLDGNTGFGAFGAGILDLSQLLSTNPANAVGSEHQVNLFVDTDFILLEVSGLNANSSQLTFTGVGPTQTVSYGDALFDAEVTRFENLIGSSLAVDTGSGFEAVSVVLAVPEPSSTAIILFLSLATVVGVRRRGDRT